MDDTSQVFGSRVHTNPTSTIITGGIFSLGVSNIMTSLVNYTIAAPINNISMFDVGYTPSMSGSMLLSLTSNDFSFEMSSMGMLNTLDGS